MKKSIFLIIALFLCNTHQTYPMARLKALSQLIIGAASAGLSTWTTALSGRIIYDETQSGLRTFKALPDDQQTPENFVQIMKRSYADLTIFVAFPMFASAFGPGIVASRLLAKGCKGLRRTPVNPVSTPKEKPLLSWTTGG